MSRIYDQLKDYINWGMGIVLALPALVLRKETIIEQFRTASAMAVLSLCLMLTTLIWFFIYIQSARNELDLFNSAVEIDKLRDTPKLALPTIVGLALLFGSLVAFGTDPLIYSIIAASLSTLTLIGDAFTKRHFGLLQRVKAVRGKKGEKEAQILYDYIMVNPIALICSLRTIAFCIAITFAVAARFSQNQSYAYMAYSLNIAAIISVEYMMYRWRRRRDKALSAIN